MRTRYGGEDLVITGVVSRSSHRPPQRSHPSKHQQHHARVPRHQHPSLTRSLITPSSQIRAARAHPHPPSLQQALQTQTSAHHLATLELNRLPTSTTTEGELHRLWIVHHQSILDLHVAETLYALTSSSSGVVPSWLKGSSGGKQGEEVGEWVEQAKERRRG